MTFDSDRLPRRIERLLAEAHDTLNAARNVASEPWDEDLQARVRCVQAEIRETLGIRSIHASPCCATVAHNATIA